MLFRGPARLVTEDNRKWWTLGAMAFGLFMIMLDATVVNVALPAIRDSTGASLSELEWVANAYALTFAVLLLTGGKLGDLLGRRRIFVLGLAVFTGMSLACGLATTPGELIAFRALQGAGAALMMPATLAIVSGAFPPVQRGLAFGIWAGLSYMALSIGPVVGGVLAEHADWSWIFFLNVPVGIAGILFTRLVVIESRDTSTEQSLDFLGLLTSATAVFAVTFAIVEANGHGWGSPLIVGLFAAAAVAAAAFIWIELRRRVPMLDLALFRNLSFSGATIVGFLVTLAMLGSFFYVSLYAQGVLGYSAVEAGASYLPLTLVLLVLGLVAGRLCDRYGPRWPMAAGLVLYGGSFALFSGLTATSSFWDLLPALLLGGTGIAFVMTPMTVAVMGNVPPAKAGIGAGVLNAARQVGGALGIAAFGALLTARETDALASGATQADAFVEGFHAAMLAGAGVTFAAAVVAALLVRPRAPAATAIDAPPRAEPAVEEAA